MPKEALLSIKAPGAVEMKWKGAGRHSQTGEGLDGQGNSGTRSRRQNGCRAGLYARLWIPFCVGTGYRNADNKTCVIGEALETGYHRK